MTHTNEIRIHIRDAGELQYATYTDYGTPLERATVGTASGRLHITRRSARYSQRPHCDLCGPFRSRYLRVIGRDEFGAEYRCSSCDEDD